MNKRRNSRRAFTLVEILIGMAIMSILASAAFSGINAYRNYSINLSNDHCKSEIVMFINKCRSYSFYNNVEGFIQIDPVRNRLAFYARNLLAYEYNLQNKSLQDSNFLDKRIYIKSSGKLNGAGTISFKDEKKVLHRITIHVGTGYVDEKE